MECQICRMLNIVHLLQRVRQKLYLVIIHCLTEKTRRFLNIIDKFPQRLKIIRLLFPFHPIRSSNDLIGAIPFWGARVPKKSP